MTLFCRGAWMRRLVLLTHFLCACHAAVYVEYNHGIEYEEGDKIPFRFNKLTSSKVLASMDLNRLTSCFVRPTNVVDDDGTLISWQKALNSLHGDVWQPGPPYQVEMLKDVYCQPLCWIDLTDQERQQDDHSNYDNSWFYNIQRDMHFNVELDFLPVALRLEDRFRITTRYWGGIPLGRLGNASETDELRFQNTNPNDSYVYNHWNIQIWYQTSPTDQSKYRVVRTVIQPMSIQRSTDLIVNGTNSCGTTFSFASNHHTSYSRILDWEPQIASGKVLFTYDVIWTLTSPSSPSATTKRWDVFVTMDDSVPLASQLAGLVLAIVINAFIYTTLIVWMMRDFSYKPIYDCEDNIVLDSGNMNGIPTSPVHKNEIRLWPLSTLVFLPPRHCPLTLCAWTGTGFHVGFAGFFVVCLHRSGLMNASLGATILAPALGVWAITAWMGGYVAARLAAIFHANRRQAIFTALASNVIFFLMAVLVIFLSYYVFPGHDAPQHRPIENGLPFFLIWLGFVVPTVLLGGYLGHARGSLAHFPVSSSTEGYHDMFLKMEELEDTPNPWEKRWRKCRIGVLFLLAGLPSVLCCFIPFSYGLAGPVFLGWYSSTTVISIAPYCLAISCSGGISALLYYRQIRSGLYLWWWPSFISGASTGLYVFLLALSWLFFNISKENVTAGTFGVYLFWFALIAVAVGCACGAAGVGACIFLNRYLYRHTTEDAMNFDAASETSPPPPATVLPGNLAPILEEENDDDESSEGDEEAPTQWAPSVPEPHDDIKSSSSLQHQAPLTPPSEGKGKCSTTTSTERPMTVAADLVDNPTRIEDALDIDSQEPRIQESLPDKESPKLSSAVGDGHLNEQNEHAPIIHDQTLPVGNVVHENTDGKSKNNIEMNDSQSSPVAAMTNCNNNSVAKTVAGMENSSGRKRTPYREGRDCPLAITYNVLSREGTRDIGVIVYQPRNSPTCQDESLSPNLPRPSGKEEREEMAVAEGPNEQNTVH